MAIKTRNKVRRSVKKYWTTNEGKMIEYGKLKDDHLLNILKFVYRLSTTGINVADRGADTFNPWFDDDMAYTFFISGDDVLEYFDFKGLTAEARKRKLTYTLPQRIFKTKTA